MKNEDKHSLHELKKKSVTTERKIKSLQRETNAGKVEGNAIQLQVWTEPEGSRSLRLPDFKTIETLRW